MDKSCEEKSKQAMPFREFPGGARGQAGFAEHGLGAGLSIGRLSRVRPLKRFEAPDHSEGIATPVCALARNDTSWGAKQGGTTSILSSLSFLGDGFFILYNHSKEDSNNV